MLFEENTYLRSLKSKLNYIYLYRRASSFTKHLSKLQKKQRSLSANLHQRTSIPLDPDLRDTLKAFSWGNTSPEAIH